MSTFRVDLVAHLNTVVGAYITSNPTILHRYWRRRPGSFAEVPLAFMDDIEEETTVQDNGTWQRNLSTGIVIVDTFGDNEQTGSRLDIALDGLLSYLVRQLNTHVGGGIMTVGGTSDFDIQQSGTENRPPINYPAARIAITGLVQEGRPS